MRRAPPREGWGLSRGRWAPPPYGWGSPSSDYFDEYPSRSLDSLGAAPGDRPHRPGSGDRDAGGRGSRLSHAPVDPRLASRSRVALGPALRRLAARASQPAVDREHLARPVRRGRFPLPQEADHGEDVAGEDE